MRWEWDFRFRNQTLVCEPNNARLSVCNWNAGDQTKVRCYLYNFVLISMVHSLSIRSLISWLTTGVQIFSSIWWATDLIIESFRLVNSMPISLLVSWNLLIALFSSLASWSVLFRKRSTKIRFTVYGFKSNNLRKLRWKFSTKTRLNFFKLCMVV